MLNKLQPWLIWLSATAFVFFQFLLQTSVSVMIPAFMQDFHISPLQVGILSSSYFYTYLTLQIPAGMLVDRFGSRLVLSGGIVLFTLACWLFAHAHNLYIAQCSRILMGLGSAPVIATTFALVAHWFPPNRFALMIGLTDTLGMMGGVGGQAYLASWVTAVGWRQTMIGCALASLIIALFIIVFIRDKTTPPALNQHKTDNPFEKLYQVIRCKQIWYNGIFVAMIWGVAIGFVGLWSVPFLQAQFNLSLTTAATASSMVFIGIAIATPLTGWLADNYNHARRLLMVGCTLLGLVSLCSVLYINYLSLVSVFILLFIFGCSTSSYIISFAIASEITAPQSRATAMAFTNMMAILVGSPILQPLIGYFLDNAPGQIITVNNTHFSVHDFRLAFIILPCCLVVALLSTIFIGQKNSN